MTDTKASPVHNAVRLFGESQLPGASLLLDGKVGQGVVRAAVGLTARMFLGPVGWWIVAADSYTKSTTGAGIADRAFGFLKSKTTTPAATSTAEASPT